jgi:hypothetical protein
MAYWGEAMTYNHGVWREQDSVAARRRSLDSELRPRAPGQGENAQRTISGQSTSSTSHPTRRRQNSAYAEEAGRLAKRYPADVDAQLFHALALSRSFPRTDSTYARAAHRRESDARSSTTSGALHYVIHAYDDPAHARQGLAAARTRRLLPMRRTRNI